MKNNNISEKLQLLIAKEKGSWLEDAQYRADNKKWLRRSQAVALTILRNLRSKGITQKELAMQMGVSAQLVNRWVQGKENFTFETISKLEDALKINLMNITNLEINKGLTTQPLLLIKSPIMRRESFVQEQTLMISQFPYSKALSFYSCKEVSKYYS